MSVCGPGAVVARWILRQAGLHGAGVPTIDTRSTCLGREMYAIPGARSPVESAAIEAPSSSPMTARA